MMSALLQLYSVCTFFELIVQQRNSISYLNESSSHPSIYQNEGVSSRT